MRRGAVHFHCCVIDGVFTEDGDRQTQVAKATALTPEGCAAVHQQVRKRVPHWFARAGHLDFAEVPDTAGSEHDSPFSLDVSVRIEGPTTA